jgi:hypothetical protein
MLNAGKMKCGKPPKKDTVGIIGHLLLTCIRIRMALKANVIAFKLGAVKEHVGIGTASSRVTRLMAVGTVSCWIAFAGAIDPI